MAAFRNSLDLAKTIVALRALRYGHFPSDTFDEYAWDMMLHMYIAQLREQPIYIDNIINLTSKNATIGNRWIDHLSATKMIEVDDDRVKLSDAAFAQMDDYHRQALAALV